MVDWAYISGCPDDSGDAELEVPGTGLDRIGANFGYSGTRTGRISSSMKNISPGSKHSVCPKCGANLVKRNGKFGEFWGCSKFPECKGTKNI